MRVSPGARVGRYDVVRPLGAGNAGGAFVALDRERSVEVALRILPPPTAEEHDRILRDDDALARVFSPSLARVHEVGELGDGRMFVATELVPGADVRQLLETGPLPPVVAADLLVQVADALHLIHGVGVFQRNLSPSTVVVRRTADEPVRAVLVDIGVGGEDAGSVAADVHALGLLLWSCVSGGAPLPAGDVPCLARESDEARSIDDVLRRTLGAGPDRIDTARDFADGLSAVWRSVGASATEPAWVAPAPPQARPLGPTPSMPAVTGTTPRPAAAAPSAAPPPPPVPAPPRSSEQGGPRPSQRRRRRRTALIAALAAAALVIAGVGFALVRGHAHNTGEEASPGTGTAPLAVPAAPRGTASSAYRSVRFAFTAGTVPSGARAVYQRYVHGAWTTTQPQFAAATAAGGVRTCARVRVQAVSGARTSTGAAKSVCGTSRPPTMRVVGSRRTCASSGGFACRAYRVEVAGLASDARATLRIAAPCRERCVKVIHIGEDGRGQLDPAAFAYAGTRLTLRVGALSDTIEVK